jgi:large subunit ribosomal protein L19
LDLIKEVDRDTMRADIPPIEVGDQVKVHNRVVEGEKQRIQVFEGVVIRKRNAAAGSTFTVRKVAYGVGVERIFPLHSPSIARIEVIRQARVKRSRLYYLRELKGKAARLKERSIPREK